MEYFLFVLLILFASLSVHLDFKRGKINKRKKKCSIPRSVETSLTKSTSPTRRSRRSVLFKVIVSIVKLNRLRTGVGRFHSSMHKWGLAPSSNYECGASEQTADHVLTAYPIHRAPHGARGLTVLDVETRCWLNNITASI